MEHYQELLERFKIPMALSLLGVVLILGGLYLSPKPQKQYPQESLVQLVQNQLIVDISGAVVSPGVYKLAEGSRIEDLLVLAGGFQDNANKEYISKHLNKAQKLSDGIKIYIPFQADQQINSNSSTQILGISATEKININTASQSQLEALSGIGQVTANKIITGRPYQTVEELISKKIIGNSLFTKIKEEITVY